MLSLHRLQNVYVVGGQVIDGKDKAGNVFSVPTNKYAEFNMFLDPLAAKMVMESNLTITLIPLNAQQKVISFERILQTLQLAEKTPESTFAHQLLSLLYQLQRKQPKQYHHMVVFLHLLALQVYIASEECMLFLFLYQCLLFPGFSCSAGNISRGTPGCSFLGRSF